MENKKHYLNLLTTSFFENQSVNYSIKQGKKKSSRIEAMMDYAYSLSKLYGKVILSDCKKGIALINFPHKKKTNLKTIGLDIKLIRKSIGINNVFKVLKREAKIKKHHPKTPYIYLFFIGVSKDYQQKGIGSALLKKVIDISQKHNLPIYLETSTVSNLPFYKKHGFENYNTIDFGHKLYLFRRFPQ